MPSIYKNLVEYKGISTCDNNNYKHFKQYNNEYILDLPCDKPDILDVTVVEVRASILNEKIVQTLKGKSLEGQILTGHKLLVCGELIFKIHYTTCDLIQVFHESIPFGIYITLPETFNPKFSVNSSVFIEDILIKKQNKRSLYCNVTMLTVAYVNWIGVN